MGSPQGPVPYLLPALRTPPVSYLCQDTGHTTGCRVRAEQPLYTREGFNWLVSRQKGSVDTSLVRPWVLPLAQLPWGIPRSSWEPPRRDRTCRDFVRAKPVRRGSGEAGGAAWRRWGRKACGNLLLEGCGLGKVPQGHQGITEPKPALRGTPRIPGTGLP